MRVLNETENIVKCDKCNAEIAYFQYEEQRETLPPMFKEIYEYFIVCPKCKKHIKIRRE